MPSQQPELHPLLPRGVDDARVMPLLLLLTSRLEDSDPRLRAVLRACADDSAPAGTATVVESVRQRDERWRTTAAELVADLQILPSMLGFELTALHPLIAEEDAEHPLVLNRLSAVLDMLGCTFTPQVAQGCLASVTERLADAAQSPAVRRATMGGSFAAAGIAGYFGIPGISSKIAEGGEWVRRQFLTVQEYTNSVAVLTAATLVLWDSDEPTEVDRIRRALADELSDLGRTYTLADREVKMRVLRAALEILQPDDEATPAVPTATPRVLGLNFDDAQRVLQSHGLRWVTDSGDTSVWSPSNWTTVHQQPAGGDPTPSSGVVALKVAKT